MSGSKLARLRLFGGRELRVCARSLLKAGKSFCLCCVDLDEFKQVNDRYGHHAGNLCLRRIVGALADVLNQRGTLFRVGGDEFVVLLPKLKPPAAGVMAERLRRAIERAGHVREVSVTASIGVVSSDYSTSVVRLLNAGDKASYAAKHTGKNRVIAFPISDEVRLAAKIHETEGMFARRYRSTLLRAKELVDSAARMFEEIERLPDLIESHKIERHIYHSIHRHSHDRVLNQLALEMDAFLEGVPRRHAPRLQQLRKMTQELFSYLFPDGVSQPNWDSFPVEKYQPGPQWIDREDLNHANLSRRLTFLTDRCVALSKLLTALLDEFGGR